MTIIDPCDIYHTSLNITHALRLRKLTGWLYDSFIRSGSYSRRMGAMEFHMSHPGLWPICDMCGEPKTRGIFHGMCEDVRDERYRMFLDNLEWELHALDEEIEDQIRSRYGSTAYYRMSEPVCRGPQSRELTES